MISELGKCRRGRKLILLHFVCLQCSLIDPALWTSLGKSPFFYDNSNIYSKSYDFTAQKILEFYELRFTIFLAVYASTVLFVLSFVPIMLLGVAQITV